ncbi:hypothetical protein T4B_9339 [Trichinella pseudospiralis]|uniref:Uncharacterized protein n=1 Tax=Trichinella pseudospiralis TaxID=6337 RepID=A0A0V1EH99_TRIPS|nr:hypothetical protein T4E_10670 [Trichinella pseudospiralis]KRY72802.1 hypothetical protein T4A_8433 [Trichinella pseudospiralis]KRZ24212.1 hypothetical protein T4B_9339 [Trichinella pseudospiralis]KRZ39359.1 hypothetical protein T4C_11247 [Trichinella pseudospiralis]
MSFLHGQGEDGLRVLVRRNFHYGRWPNLEVELKSIKITSTARLLASSSLSLLASFFNVSTAFEPTTISMAFSVPMPVVHQANNCLSKRRQQMKPISITSTEQQQRQH